MKSKKCNKCGHTKPLEEFHKDKNCKGGRTTICKLCRNTQGNIYRKTLKGFLKNIYI